MRATFDARVRELPRSEIGPSDLAPLAKFSPEELSTLLGEWRRFTEAGLETLEALAGAAAPNREPSHFSQAAHYSTGIEQQSALTFVSPELGFVIASDDSSALWAVKPKRGEVEVKEIRQDDGELSGIEGARYNPRTKRLRLLSEDSRRVWEMEVSRRGGLSDPEEIGRLEKLGKKKNKGFEGLDLLPAELSPDKTEYQLAIHEGKPRRIALLDPESLEIKGLADVPESVRKALPDLSDSAVSPRGTLFLLSDEGNAFVELAIRKLVLGVGGGQPLPRWTLVPLGTTEIDDTHLPLGGAERLQPEGLSFDHKGDLWVACEANGLLIRFAAE